MKNTLRDSLKIRAGKRLCIAIDLKKSSQKTKKNRKKSTYSMGGNGK